MTKLLDLVERTQTIGANFHLLLATLVDERSAINIRHETPIGVVLGMTHGMSIHRTLAANIASLCHSKLLPSLNSAKYRRG